MAKPCFVTCAAAFQVLLLVLYATCADYADEGSMGKYSTFQDVHVMVFLGFGFLMTFLANYAWSSVGYNMLIAAVAGQWAILTYAFWGNVFSGSWETIQLDLSSLVVGDFGAAAVLITFGAVLGRTSMMQMLCVAVVEVILYSLNETILFKELEITDIGGSMVIHAFGAYFGVALSLALGKTAGATGSAGTSKINSTVAMVGTLFLYVFWPSFNSAPADAGSPEESRAVINTFFSLAAACVMTFASSAFFREGKFSMEDVQNATIAGGVAVGASADLNIHPAGAIAIGGLAGVLSTFGFARVSGYLEERFGLQDTCGVHNLHGMPALLGVIASAIALAANDGSKPGNQILAAVVTLAIATVGGYGTGLLVSRLATDNEKNQYSDLPYWHLDECEELEGEEEAAPEKEESEGGAAAASDEAPAADESAESAAEDGELKPEAVEIEMTPTSPIKAQGAVLAAAVSSP